MNDEELLKALEPFYRIQGTIEHCRELDRDAIFNCSFSVAGSGASNGGRLTEKEVMNGYYAYIKLQHRINQENRR